MYLYKENMFTINLEDGREAPSKASNPQLKIKLIFITYKIIVLLYFKQLISRISR